MVVTDKVEELNNSRANFEDIQRIEQKAEKVRVNNLDEEGQILKKLANNVLLIGKNV